MLCLGIVDVQLLPRLLPLSVWQPGQSDCLWDRPLTFLLALRTLKLRAVTVIIQFRTLNRHPLFQRLWRISSYVILRNGPHSEIQRGRIGRGRAFLHCQPERRR